MLCPQCGKHYGENETVCRLCAVPLCSPQRGMSTESAVVPRPAGIDKTLESIRQDINAIDRRPCKPAGFFVRFAAYMIDNLLLTLITLVPAFLAFVLLKRSGVQFSFDPEQIMRWLWLLFVLPNTVLSCIYFSYFHAATGQTVGKLLCGVRVITAAGRPLGWMRSLVRCAGYFLSSFVLYAGFFWVVLNRKKRGWHDYLAGTMVVHVPDSARD